MMKPQVMEGYSQLAAKHYGNSQAAKAAVSGARRVYQELDQQARRLEGRMYDVTSHENRASTLAGMTDSELRILNAERSADLGEAIRRTTKFYRRNGFHNSTDDEAELGSKIKHLKQRANEFRHLTEGFQYPIGGDYGETARNSISRRDPVYNMLYELYDKAWKTGSEGHDHDQTRDLRRDIDALQDQFVARKLDKPTYMSLLDGTHPLIAEARRLSLDTEIENKDELMEEQKAYY